jgi:hypothetical protein
MKTFVRVAVALIAITAVCQASLVLAEDYYGASGSGQQASLIGQEKAVGQAPCNSCNQGCCSEQGCGECGNCCGCEMGCDECPPWGLVGFTGFDSFKGISDFDSPSNFGLVTGLNFGAPIPGLRDYGFGWQVGISYGVYDFDGFGRYDSDGTLVGQTAHCQQQTFVTTGFFRKAQCDQRLSFGIVYDWMYNTDYGLFHNDPTLGQWRGQIEYAVSGCNGIGLWGAQRNLGSEQVVNGIEVFDRALSQVNLFWHHKFCSGADSWLWFGIPDHGRYSGDKSFADWMIGANVQVPLSDRLALYANASYLHPSASAGADAAVEQGYDVGMGVMWFFGGHARSNAINGKCWQAYLPVANNSSFLVEQAFIER